MVEIEIRARENGPYLIDAAALLIDAAGNESPVQGKKIALCRCGGSQNKPFCDGTHRKNEFKAAQATVRLDVAE